MLNTLNKMVTGSWSQVQTPPVFAPVGTSELMSIIRRPVYVVHDSNASITGIAVEGRITSDKPSGDDKGLWPLIGVLPPLYPEWLGDRAFLDAHGLRFPYVGGAMARGISSTKLIIELARSGMMGFFGSAGLPLQATHEAIKEIKEALEPQGLPWGVNLIHTPHNMELEEQTVELYLRENVSRVCAAAFMRLTPALVWYSASGLYRDSEGMVRRRNHLFGKISRPEVARHFMEPAPKKVLDLLLKQGRITPEEAELALEIPLAGEVTVESDSGGHTDNRPLTVLFSSISSLRSKIEAEHGYDIPIRLGAAGGLATPEALSAAYAMGAAYVMVGTAHQACVESGVPGTVKSLLAQADMADVIMTPSPDMFELGGKVQVLKKGSMMGMRGNQLLALYNRYNSIDDIPQDTREQIEKTIFRASLDDIWEETASFFNRHEPSQTERASSDPRHKMALIFRWYLGKSSKWAIDDDKDRMMDYQVWCGPAIGAFNAWVRGSFLEEPENRTVKQVALNLLEGAAYVTRAAQLRSFGVAVLPECFSYRPSQLDVDSISDHTESPGAVNVKQ
jgi:trans-AT polyketide synthase/acyltransferase/oxidoreductase domain-containing protein